MEELIEFICADGLYSPEFIVRIFVLLFVCGFLATAIRAIANNVFK